MASLSSLGKNSKTTFLILQNEKPAIEFTAGAALKNGQQVKLNATGEVVLWVKTDALNLLIGTVYTQHAEDAAQGETVTVITRGYILMKAMASADLAPGLVTVSAYDSSTVADEDGTTGYVVYEAAGANTANAWLLTNPAAAGDIVEVLLMG